MATIDESDESDAISALNPSNTLTFLTGLAETAKSLFVKLDDHGDAPLPMKKTTAVGAEEHQRQRQAHITPRPLAHSSPKRISFLERSERDVSNNDIPPIQTSRQDIRKIRTNPNATPKKHNETPLQSQPLRSILKTTEPISSRANTTYPIVKRDYKMSSLTKVSKPGSTTSLQEIHLPAKISSSSQQYQAHDPKKDAKASAPKSSHQRCYESGPDFKLPERRAYQRFSNLSPFLAESKNCLLREQLDSSAREIHNLLNKVKKMESELNNTTDQLKNLETLRNHSVEDKVRMMNKISDLEEKLQSMSEYEQEYVQLSAEYADLKKRHEIKIYKNRELQEQIKRTESTILSKQDDVQNALTDLEKVRGDLQESREKCQRMQRDWVEYKTRLDCIMVKKDRELQELYQRAEMYAVSTASSADIMDSLRAERDQIAETLSQTKRQHVDVERRLEKMTQRVRAAERRADELETSEQSKSPERPTASSTPNDQNPVADSAYMSVTETTTSTEVLHLVRSLSEKEGFIETLVEENRTLKLKYEILEESVSRTPQRAYVKAVTWSTPKPKRAIDKVAFGVGGFLHRRPLIRIVIYTYMIVFHLIMLPFLVYSPDV